MGSPLSIGVRGVVGSMWGISLPSQLGVEGMGDLGGVWTCSRGGRTHAEVTKEVPHGTGEEGGSEAQSSPDSGFGKGCDGGCEVIFTLPGD